MIRSGLVRVATTRFWTALSLSPLWYAWTAFTYWLMPLTLDPPVEDEHPTTPSAPAAARHSPAMRQRVVWFFIRLMVLRVRPRHPCVRGASRREREPLKLPGFNPRSTPRHVCGAAKVACRRRGQHVGNDPE